EPPLRTQAPPRDRDAGRIRRVEEGQLAAIGGCKQQGVILQIVGRQAGDAGKIHHERTKIVTRVHIIPVVLLHLVEIRWHFCNLTLYELVSADQYDSVEY